MRTISSRDAALKGAKDDTGRRVFAAPEPPPPVDKHLEALERIGARLESLAQQPAATGDKALAQILVQLAAQTSAIAEMVASLARQAPPRPQAAPITTLRITARDYADRITTVEVVRGTPSND